jgi:hypothetical protein
VQGILDEIREAPDAEPIPVTIDGEVNYITVEVVEEKNDLGLIDGDMLAKMIGQHREEARQEDMRLIN